VNETSREGASDMIQSQMHSNASMQDGPSSHILGRTSSSSPTARTPMGRTDTATPNASATPTASPATRKRRMERRMKRLAKTEKVQMILAELNSTKLKITTLRQRADLTPCLDPALSLSIGEYLRDVSENCNFEKFEVDLLEFEVAFTQFLLEDKYSKFSKTQR
jgi:hypothetical protein